MKHISYTSEELNLAYLSGLFDGEGSIYLGKTGQSYQAHVAVGITYYPTLLDFQLCFGGNIRKDHNNGKQLYKWDITNRKDAIIICKKMLPYLREKKIQAEIMIEYCTKFPGANNRKLCRYEREEMKWYYEKLKILKKGENLIDFPAKPETLGKQLILFERSAP